MDISIKEQFRTYLANCVQTRRQTGKSFIIGRTAVDSYVSFVETDKLFDYAPDEWKEITSIFDITSSQEILVVIEKLFADERFRIKDSGESSQYYRSNAIKQYYCFLKARELFGDCKKNDLVTLNSDFTSFPHQQIFYGAPGTGKSHTIQQVTDAQPKENVFRTTFHPDSDYSTFVGCYKPSKEAPNPLSLHKLHELYPEFKTKVENRPLHRFITKYYNSFRLLTEKEAESVFDKIETSSTVTAEVPKIMATIEEIPSNSAITYTFVPQTFTKAYLRAWQTTEPVYLVIEEINRGNCAQIFGDLFQLLDRKNGVSEYPIKPDADLGRFITENLTSPIEGIPDEVRKGEELSLPSNLYIWATMNTSDQSLFPIDSAFKRRWEWRYIKIAEGRDEATRELLNWTVKFDYKEDDKPFTFECSWWDFIKAINEKIAEATSSDDKKLGYFFCKPKDKNSTTIDEERFVGKVVFYLWNDVFKDEENPIFKVNEGKGEPSFDAFYKEDEVGKTVVDTAALRKFMHNVFGENKDQYTETEKSEE